MKNNPRVICSFQGELPGPLLIVVGGMHGNEPAGIKAIDLMGKMLEVEPITNIDFKYRGNFVGIIGNLEAYNQQQRFINRDLNRMFLPEIIAKTKSLPVHELSSEEIELKGIIETVNEAIAEIKPSSVVVLDLHTTSSYGGIFTIPSEDPESLRIAIELHAPVIKDMLKGIRGTTLHYFNEANLRVPTVAVTFESGQHDDPLSINRAIAAITNCMRSIGAVREEDVENRHDSLLIEYSAELPKVARLVSRHGIDPGDSFRMESGFKNFGKIKAGQHIATDKNGPIYASDDGCLLMPLYQEKGEDGFFLIQELEGY